MSNTSNRVLLANYLTGQQGSTALGRNFVQNSSAFQNTNGVTASGTATVTRNTTTPLTAISDFSITLPNNATDGVTWTLNTLDNSLSGQNCELRFDYTASSIGTNVVARVLQGSTIVAQTSALSTATTVRTISLNAPCGDISSATTIVVANGTGNTGTSSMKVANATYGKATNLGNVSQAQFIGSAYIAGTTNCTGWTRTNTVLGAFSTDADCPGPTVESNPGPGVIQTTDTNLPEFTVNNLPPGVYEVVMSVGNLSFSVNDNFRVAISDGTTTPVAGQSGAGSVVSTAGNQGARVVRAMFTYTTAGNRTFSLYTASATGDVTLINNNVYNQLGFQIYRFPLSSEVAVRMDAANTDWKSDLTFLPSAGFGTVTSTNYWYRRIGDTLHVRGKFNAGTVAGSTAFIDLPSEYIIDTAKFTTTANQAVGFYTIAVTSAGPTTFNTSSISGRLFFDGSDNNSLFLSYRGGSNVFNKDNGNIIASTGDTISFEFMVPITGWTGNQNAPLLVGGVTSNSTGLERIERATITNAGTCVIATQSGTWLTSPTHPTTGQCAFVLSGWAVAPSCTCNFAGAPASDTCRSVTTTTTTLTTQSYNSGGSPSDQNYHIICMGPRL